MTRQRFAPYEKLQLTQGFLSTFTQLEQEERELHSHWSGYRRM